MRLLDDVVWVRRFQTGEKIGLIWIPPKAQEKSEQGKVIAVGPGRRLKSGIRKPMDVAPGDHVLISNWHVEEIDLEGKEVLVTREPEVLARLGH
jgi:chaperonin GroES